MRKEGKEKNKGNKGRYAERKKEKGVKVREEKANEKRRKKD